AGGGGFSGSGGRCWKSWPSAGRASGTDTPTSARPAKRSEDRNAASLSGTARRRKGGAGRWLLHEADGIRLGLAARREDRQDVGAGARREVRDLGVRGVGHPAEGAVDQLPHGELAVAGGGEADPVGRGPGDGPGVPVL